MEWFIVAIVYVAGDTYFSQMQNVFQTKELCQKYYQTNMAVRDDIVKMYPNQTGHTLVCLTPEQIKEIQMEIDNKKGFQI